MNHIAAQLRAEWNKQFDGGGCAQSILREAADEIDRLSKIIDDNLERTADGELICLCDKLYCPNCGNEVKQETSACYCWECGNPDDGQWPPQPPLPLFYESCFSKPAMGDQQR